MASRKRDTSASYTVGIPSRTDNNPSGGGKSGGRGLKISRSIHGVSDMGTCAGCGQVTFASILDENNYCGVDSCREASEHIGAGEGTLQEFKRHGLLKR